jgi:hypothetical protein
MPRARRASRKRSRASSLAKVRALAFDMEEPLNEAIDHVVALRLMGWGLTALDKDNGRAVLAASWEASKRLDLLKDIWEKMFRATA